MTDFWKAKYESVKSKLDGYDPTVLIEEYKRVKLCRDIYQNISDLIIFAANRYTIPLNQLKAQDYVQILNQIRPRIIDHGQNDDEFLSKIKALLLVDLNKFELFRNHVIKDCGLSVVDNDGLHGYLIDQCLNGQFVEIIQNLQSAFLNSYDELESSDTTGINRLNQAAKDVLSKLVLFNVKNEWMAQYRNECMRNQGYE